MQSDDRALPPSPKQAGDAQDQARGCSAEEITASVRLANELVLAGFLENPRLTAEHVRTIVERRDLHESLLTRIISRKDWLRQPGVRRALVAHPHTPGHVALTLARDLEVMELASISLQTSVSAPVRRFVDDVLLTRVGQLPLGQKLALARRGPGRVASELLLWGDERVARATLENPHVTEAHLLRILSNDKLRLGALSVIAAHGKWGRLGTVQAAVIRHPQAPFERIIALLPGLPLAELRQLDAESGLSPGTQKAVRDEMESRSARLQTHP